MYVVADVKGPGSAHIKIRKNNNDRQISYIDCICGFASIDVACKKQIQYVY